MLNKLKQFLREVKIEIKKVSWPSRQETIASTIIVMVTLFLLSIFIGLSDLVLSQAFALIMK